MQDIAENSMELSHEICSYTSCSYLETSTLLASCNMNGRFSALLTEDKSNNQPYPTVSPDSYNNDCSGKTSPLHEIVA